MLRIYIHGRLGNQRGGKVGIKWGDSAAGEQWPPGLRRLHVRGEGEERGGEDTETQKRHERVLWRHVPALHASLARSRTPHKQDGGNKETPAWHFPKRQCSSCLSEREHKLSSSLQGIVLVSVGLPNTVSWSRDEEESDRGGGIG